MIARARPARGFTLFELAVVVIVAALLITVLLNRLHSYQHQAREVAVQRIVGTLRTVLNVKNAQLSVAKREHDLQQFMGANPVSWLVKPPPNYLGDYYSPEGNALPDDSWYFDPAKKELVYIVSKSQTFPRQELTLLRFKVKFSDLTLQQGKTPGLPATNKGLVLDQVTEKHVDN